MILSPNITYLSITSKPQSHISRARLAKKPLNSLTLSSKSATDTKIRDSIVYDSIMGFVGFMYRQKTAHPAPLAPQNLTGKTAIVTGGNVGIGLAAAKQLAAFHIARIILAVRTSAKGEQAKAEIQQAHPDCTVEVWALDMNAFESIVAFGRRAEGLDRLDIVLLNAGVKKHKWETNSTTGHETSIQVNHLGTSLLSLLLLPPLRATAAQIGIPSRLTLTSSEVHMWTTFKERTAPDLFAELDKESNWGNPDRYNVSKLLNVLWSRELAAHVPATQVIINSANPGLVKSSLHRENKNNSERMFTEFFGWTPEEGARCLVNAAVIQGPESHGGYTSEAKLSK